MRTPVVALSLVATVLMVAGCGVSGPGELPYPYEDEATQDSGLEPGSSGQGAGTPGSGATSGSGSGTSGSSGSGSSTSGSSGSSGSGAGVGSTGATTGSGGGGGFCAPDPSDDICVACAKDACCDEVNACAADDNCSCWVQCMAQTLGDVFACGQQCGFPGQALSDLGDCTGVACQAECGF